MLWLVVWLIVRELSMRLRLLKRRDRGNRKDPPKLPSGAAWQAHTCEHSIAQV